MKTYSIGRDINCDIVINDSTDVVSRRHALLNVTPSGKMTIVDQSANGTYVNGIRISPNVPVPVTRKDVISLAHVARFDWNCVPKVNQWSKYAVGAGAAVVIALCVIFGMKRCDDSHSRYDYQQMNPMENVSGVDSTEIKKKEAARRDSLRDAARLDSLRKLAEKSVRDSLKDARKGRRDSTKTVKSVKGARKGKEDVDTTKSQTPPAVL